MSVPATTATATRAGNSSIHPQPYDSALAMARAIRDGTVTSRQLVEMHIERIERLDGPVNAVIIHNFEAARRRADEADEKARQCHSNSNNQLGVFHGVPMTIKESNPTPGIRTTMGDPWGLTNLLPPWTSYETTRTLLEDGGAILIGKTNLPMDALDWEANNPLYGRTGNPYNLNRSPGGSSGGAAAALAAGFTPMELGSDIGGSIRIPAVMCGVVGHCATRGVLPSMKFQLGCCGGCIDHLVDRVMDHITWMARTGPMARTVEDVTAMLELLGGDVAQGLGRPKEGSSLKDYRIAVWRSHGICPTGREVSMAMKKTVAALEAAGATVEELEPPLDPIETYKIYLRFLGPIASLHLPKQQKRNAKKGRAKDSFPADIRSPFWEMHMAATHGVPDGTKSAFEEMDIIWGQYLKKFDAVLSPIFPCEAWPNASQPRDTLADANLLSRKLMVDGEERFYGDCLFWPHLSVLCGLPATGFPVCFSQQSGLPVGLQAFGAKGNDFIVLDVVQKLIEALDMNHFHPPAGFS